MSTAASRLQAGVLSCILDGADIRDLRVGHQRVLTRLYIAVRDEKWNTIPFDWRQVAQRTSAGQFEVRLECRVDAPPVRAEWDVTVAGDAAGEFAYSINGQALGSFRYAKLGLNLHHPLPESLGARYLARRGERAVTGTIPALVEPQFFIDGKLTGMFMPYDELVLQASADDELVFRFKGDEFEMQDHRNWTDYNLKSYGTPLEVPLPLQAEDGQAIHQGVTIDLRRARGLRDEMGAPGAGQLERMAVDRSIVGQLPRLGSEFPDEAPEASEEAHSLVAALGLDYVRLNLDLTSEDAGSVSARRCRQVSSWDRPVELVLVVSAGGARPEELAWLDHWLEQAQPDLERVVVFEGPRGFFIGRRTSPSATVRAYRDVVERRCGPVAMVSATEQYFAELNRWWPDLAGVDGVGFTICPQVHAADDASLMENSRGQSDPIYTARARSGGRAVHVTSMAIIGKFGPYPAGVPDVPVLSAYGDERQHELLGAAWTVSSLRQMLEAGAVSATYFELFGGRGLLRTDEDGHKCVIVPVYRVLEAVLRWRGSTVVRVGRLGGEVVGLGAEWADRSELLVANLSPDQREFELEGLAGQVTEVSELVCDHSAGAQWAQLRPDAFRADGRGQLRLTLDSYGVGRVHTS